MSHTSRLLALTAGVLAALAPGAQAAVPQVLKPAHHTHALEGVTAKVTIALPYRTDHPVTVSWATEPGTAREGSDYVGASGQVTIKKGKRKASLLVQTLRDHSDELTEEFRVRFSAPVGAPLLGRTSTIVRVLDRNPSVAEIAPRTVTEPGPSGTSAPLDAVVSLRGASAGKRAVTIGYEIVAVDLTANSDDATLGAGRLHFARGETSKAIPAVVKGDAVDEDDEHLLVVLSGDRGVYARPGATITITDDPGDAPPAASIGDITAPENSSGAVEVPITLSAPSERPVTVTYTTAPGTASVDDFVMKVGTVTFPANTKSVNASVVLVDDTVDEPNQTFTIALSDPADATIDRGTATFTITDDDPPPIITATGTVVSETDPTATVMLKLSQPTESVVTVVPTISSHTARFREPGEHECMNSISDPDPYDALAPPDDLTVTFPPGATTASIVVTLCDDGEYEPDDIIDFTFGSPVNAILGTTSAEIRIVSDDPLPEITVADVTVNETDEMATLTLTLDRPTGKTVTVVPTISGHTATFGDACSMNGSDPDPPDVITPPSDLTVTFPPGSTVATIELQLCDDENPEPDELVNFHFSSPVNATLGTTAAAITIAANAM